MKKFTCIVIAAICALSCAAFGFSACSKEKDSDVVTEEEWKAAMASSNALNVTMKITSDSQTTENDGSAKQTKTTNGGVEIRTALEYYSGIVTSSLYIKGNACLYSTETEQSTYTGDAYDTTVTVTMYEVFEESASSSVTKTTETDEEDDWDGYYYNMAGTVYSCTAYYQCCNYLTMFQSSYSSFTYEDGAYKYETSGRGTFYVRINDGYLTSIISEKTSSLAYNNYSYSSTDKYEIKFSDYGTTTVEVPEEYTYANYSVNHAE